MLRAVVARLPLPCVLFGLALVLTPWWHHDAWLSGLGAILILAVVLIPMLPARRVATAAGLPFSLAGQDVPTNREAFTSPVD